MFLQIMKFLFMFFGLIIMIISIINYSKLIKDAKENLGEEIDKDVKFRGILNIVTGTLYFISGLLLVLNILPDQYAFIYFVGIFLLEKAAEKMSKLI